MTAALNDIKKPAIVLTLLPSAVFSWFVESRILLQEETRQMLLGSNAG
jgi:hypothetical protein